MRQRIPGHVRLPLLAAASAFLIHLVCNPHYGFHGDELYFIICGRPSPVELCRSAARRSPTGCGFAGVGAFPDVVASRPGLLRSHRHLR